MRKYLLLTIVIFLTACGFSPDKAEVRTLVNQALNIECPSEFTILKSYNARVIDDYLEAVVIEFSEEGLAAFKDQLDLAEWTKNGPEYRYSTQLGGRYSATLTLNTDNRRLLYERLHK